MKIALMFFMAFLGGFANAMFAVGQRKAVDIQNGLAFVGACLLVSALSLIVLSYFESPAPQYWAMVKKNYGWILLSGAGTAVLNFCLYFLIAQYGMSSYALYAIFAMSLTILVGILFLAEDFNLYYGLSLFFAIISVSLFALAKLKG